MMKNFTRLCLWMVALAFPATSRAIAADGDTLCIHLKNGRTDVFGPQLLVKQEQTGDSLRLTLVTDTVVGYKLSEIQSTDNNPGTLPNFISYKFNNKYNDQLPTDVVAEVKPDTIKVQVGAIGKWLTASFNLNNPQAKAYVDEKEQTSKVSRLHFNEPKTYTLALPDMYTLSYRKVKDEVWSNPDIGYQMEEIPLTTDMLSTNAPSNFGDEGLDRMLDGNINTYFHSTWGEGAYTKLPLDEHPYLQVHLQHSIRKWAFEYTTRNDTDERCPSSFLIEASNDGTNWTEVRTLTEEDGIPTNGYALQYTSPVIDMGLEYEYLRFTMTSATYKNYLCLAEFSLSEVVWENTSGVPELISPAVYEHRWVPFGRNTTVEVDWLTDKSKNVPTINLFIENNAMPADKETYLNAQIKISGNGVFSDFTGDVMIKGRGNTSWQGKYGKSPYRLKFATSVKPFGLTKGKNWVLLANNQDNSMMTNAVAMKIAKMAGTAGANDIIPVELYMNGQYWGSYNFTQHVGLSNNSIDLADETNATLIELDSYYDEDYKFRDLSYYLYVNLKDPDIAALVDGKERFSLIQSDFNNFTAAVKEGPEYANLVDVDMLARYLFVNELVLNLELGHPKSAFLYKEDLLAMHSRYVFGPVWDFDWAYGYEGSHNYCVSDPEVNYYDKLTSGYGKSFFKDLRHNSEEVKRACYQVWTDFMDNHLEELKDFISEYYTYAQPSFENNNTKWGDGDQYATIAENMHNWLVERAHYVYNNMETFDLSTPLPIEIGDVNQDGAITMADVVCVMNYILGQENDTFDFAQADADANSEITINDVVHIIALVMNQPADLTRHLRLPLAEVSLQPSSFAIAPGIPATLPLVLHIAEGSYSALQADINLPEGMTLDNVTLAELPDVQVQVSELSEGTYRIALHSRNGEALPTGKTVLSLDVTTDRMIPQTERVVSLSNAQIADTLGEDNRIAPRSTNFNLSTANGMDATTATVQSIRGGEALYIESLTDGTVHIHLMDGRLLHTCTVKAGQTRIELPRGIYIVNNQKIIIK